MPSRLDNLPTPDVLSIQSTDDIYAESRAWVLQRLPDFGDVEDTDPLWVAVQAWAYREWGLQQRQNDSARACFLNTATKGDLDNIAANFSVFRKVLVAADPDADPPVEEVLETDRALRARTAIRLEQCAPGSEAWFEGLVLEAENPPRVKDVRAVSPVGGEVDIYLLYADNIPVADYAAVRSALLTFVTDDANKFMGVDPTINDASAVMTPFAAEIRILAGNVFTTVQTAVVEAMETFFEDSEVIGRSILIGEMYDALLSVPGVETGVISNPTGNVTVGDLAYPALMGTPTITQLT